MTGFFQLSERMTRELTYMSSFEMAYNKAKQEGLNEQDARNRAVNEAMAMTQEGLFDYTRFNKARVMYETPVGQLLTQFMSYSTMMSSLLVRHAHTVIVGGKTLKERRQAAVAFAGILGQTAALAGVNGIWGMSVIVPLLSGLWKALSASVQWALGDDEDKEEKDQLLAAEEGDPFLNESINDWIDYEYIPNTFGPGGSLSNYFTASDETWLTAQLMAQRGVPAAFGWDLSGSLSLNNMFMQDEIIEPSQDVAAMFLDIAGQLRIAPVLGAGTQIVKGLMQAYDGEIFKGIETASPGFIKGGVKAARRRQEGKLNYKQQEILPAEYYTLGKSLQLGLGVPDTMEQMLARDSFRQARWAKSVENERQKLIRDYETTLQKVIKDKSVTFDKANEDQRILKIREDIVVWNLTYVKDGFDPIDFDTTLGEKVVREGLNRYVARLSNGLLTDFKSATSNPVRTANRYRRARAFLGSFFPGGYVADEGLRQKLEDLDAQLKAKLEEVAEERKSKIGEKLKDSSYEIDWSE